MACCDSRRLQSVWRSRFPPSSFSIFRSSLPLWRFGPVGLVHSLPSSFPLFSSFSSSFFFLFFSFFLRSSCVRHRPVSSVYPSAFAPYIQTLPGFTEFLLMVAGRYGGSLGPYSKMSRFFFVAPPGDRCLGRISVGPESDRSVLPSFFTGFPAPRPHRVHLFLLGTSGSLPSFDSDGGLPSLFCCCCCCLVFFSALPFEIHQPTSSRAGPFSLYTQATSEVWNRVLLGFHRLGLVATGFRSVPRCVSLRSLFFPSRVDRVVFFFIIGLHRRPSAGFIVLASVQQIAAGRCSLPSCYRVLPTCRVHHFVRLVGFFLFAPFFFVSIAFGRPLRLSWTCSAKKKWRKSSEATSWRSVHKMAPYFWHRPSVSLEKSQWEFSKSPPLVPVSPRSTFPHEHDSPGVHTKKRDRF